MSNQPVVFFSKYAEHRIVYKHSTSMLADGNKLIKTAGRAAEFHRGRYETSDPAIIEFLRNHPAYGVDFFAEDDAQANVPMQAQVSRVTGDEVPEVAKPVRTKKGERAAVAVKATTAADLDAESEG